MVCVLLGSSAVRVHETCICDPLSPVSPGVYSWRHSSLVVMTRDADMKGVCRLRADMLAGLSPWQQHVQA